MKWNLLFLWHSCESLWSFGINVVLFLSGDALREISVFSIRIRFSSIFAVQVAHFGASLQQSLSNPSWYSLVFDSAMLSIYAVFIHACMIKIFRNYMSIDPHLPLPSPNQAIHFSSYDRQPKWCLPSGPLSNQFAILFFNNASSSPFDPRNSNPKSTSLDPPIPAIV